MIQTMWFYFLNHWPSLIIGVILFGLYEKFLYVNRKTDSIDLMDCYVALQMKRRYKV